MRDAVTNWTNWRDVFKSETVRDLDAKPIRSQLDLDAYRKRDTAHTWFLDDYRYPASQRERVAKVPCYLSRFATLKIQTGTDEDRSWRTVYLNVEPTEQAIEIVAKHSCLVEYDTMNFEIIGWPDGRSLVVCHNSKIIGGPWVAKINSSTIPSALLVVPNDE